jgi:DNA-binding MarR family transcriptional regulator
MARTRPVDPAADIGLLALAVASGITASMREQMAAAGFDDVRDAHGYVIQGLLAGDTTVTALAARLGVSAQAVSKSVSELERAGYVRRGHDPDDGRARPLELTSRGDALVDASRRARRAVARDLARRLGTRDQAELVRLLQRAAEHYGALEALTTRRLRPPD